MTGKQTANVLQVLGDTADKESIPELDTFAASTDEETAAAKDAINTIRIRMEDPESHHTQTGA